MAAAPQAFYQPQFCRFGSSLLHWDFHLLKERLHCRVTNVQDWVGYIYQVFNRWSTIYLFGNSYTLPLDLWTSSIKNPFFILISKTLLAIYRRGSEIKNAVGKVDVENQKFCEMINTLKKTIRINRWSIFYNGSLILAINEGHDVLLLDSLYMVLKRWWYYHSFGEKKNPYLIHRIGGDNKNWYILRSYITSHVKDWPNLGCVLIPPLSFGQRFASEFHYAMPIRSILLYYSESGEEMKMTTIV